MNISRDKDGWFIESHPKLDPVATTTDGIYIAGTCAAPKDIPDSVAQARAAAGRILARTIRGTIDIDAVFAEVDEDKCSGCRICNELCPYSAIVYDAEKKRSSVISALCKACGACVAACPSERDNGAPLHRRADLRADRGGAGMSFEPKIVGFLCNWCSYTGRRSGRHQPDPLRTERAHHPRDVHGPDRPDLRAEGPRGRGGRRAHLRLPPGRLPLLRGQLQDDAPLPACSRRCWPTMASRTPGCGWSG